jgi:hypothetical protein
MTVKTESANQDFSKMTSNFSAVKLSVITALILFMFVNLFYYANSQSFLSANSSPTLSVVSLILLLGGAFSLSWGALTYLRIERRIVPAADGQSKIPWRTGRIISDALFRNSKVVIFSALIYGVFFALIDGILVYQPSVNFASQYLVSSPSSFVEFCCGPPGYVPVGLVYFPAQHLGLQLIPISILTMILVSVLVGLNVSLLYSSIKQTRTVPGTSSPASGRKFAGGALGASLGLFAGCPTCAAAFFLSMIAGSGSTVFSAVVSQYQLLIVGLSIPLLFFSIIYQARNLKNFLAGCSTGI